MGSLDLRLNGRLVLRILSDAAGLVERACRSMTALAILHRAADGNPQRMQALSRRHRCLRCVTRGLSASPDGGSHLPAFAPELLTAEQYTAAQRFHLKVFGTPMFFSGPVCDGKHGFNCAKCLKVHFEVEQEKQRLQAEAARVAAIQQPWSVAA